MGIVCNCCHSKLIEKSIDWDNCKKFPRAIVVGYGLYNKCSSCIKSITNKVINLNDERNKQ